MIAFCTHDPEYGFELWCLDVEERRAWCIAPKLRLNSVCGDPFVWLSDSKRVVAKFVIEDVELPVKNTVPTGPIVEESSEGEIRANRTYQDLLKVRKFCPGRARGGLPNGSPSGSSSVDYTDTVFE
mmetsp:Transcript_2771/g.12480  ORF Transcript_2771/g.12480 Transcript_2771/m.12480 type:complete len:126 (+) Transcript_2771:893-1270(+)